MYIFLNIHEKFNKGYFLNKGNIYEPLTDYTSFIRFLHEELHKFKNEKLIIKNVLKNEKLDDVRILITNEVKMISGENVPTTNIHFLYNSDFKETVNKIIKNIHNEIKSIREEYTVPFIVRKDIKRFKKMNHAKISISSLEKYNKGIINFIIENKDQTIKTDSMIMEIILIYLSQNDLKIIKS